MADPETPINDAYASYAEARVWAHWLACFTPRELAQSMYISVDLAGQFCTALTRNGTCAVAEEVGGEDGLERIYEVVPLPPGPRFRPRRTPVERDPRECPGVYSEAPPRGRPVGGTALSAMQQRERARQRRPGR
jgi:hypothetical protein